MSDRFTVVIDIAMVDVYHIDVFQCNSVHSSDPIGIDPSWWRLGLHYLLAGVLEYLECKATHTRSTPVYSNCLAAKCQTSVEACLETPRHCLSSTLVHSHVSWDRHQANS